MALIQNLTLEIVENEGAAAALVTYTLVASAADVQRRRTYLETIQLFGVDEGAGEDGTSEPINFGRRDGSVTFPIASPAQSRVLALPASALDEDRSASPFPVPLEDEIRARMWLTPTTPATVVAQSNIVFRGGPTNAPPILG